MGRALGDHLQDGDVSAVKESAQQKLHAFRAVIEADVKESIVYQAEFFDVLKVFRIEVGAKNAHEHHPFCEYCIIKGDEKIFRQHEVFT